MKSIYPNLEMLSKSLNMFRSLKLIRDVFSSTAQGQAESQIILVFFNVNDFEDFGTLIGIIFF